jgi:hypothetical protein
LIIAVVLGLVLLCGLGSCAAVVMTGLGSKSSQTSSAKQAEEHYAAAMKAVESASTSLKKAEGADAPSVTVIVTDTTKQLRTGRDELAAAKVAAEQLPDSQGKTDYLASIASANSAMDALQDLIAYMNTASGMAAKALEGAAMAKKANSSLSSAFTSGNHGNYSTMRSQAVSASTNYTKAALLFTQAHELDPSAGLDKAARYAQKRKLQADIVIRMADEGRSGRLSAYNADIKKENALGKQAEAAGEPAIVSDPNWAANRISDLSKRIDEAAAKADEMRAKALKELGI